MKRARGLILPVVLLLCLAALLAAVAPTSQPTNVEAWLTEMFPYLAVMLLGVVVGLAELASTFADYPTDAIISAWGLGLIALNGAMAAIVLAVVRLYAPDANLFLLVLAVGVGFQALIRTEFTLAKEFSGGDGGDLSLNLGWLYDQFQALCKTQIDQALMRRRQPIVRELVDAFPGKLTLFNMAYYTVVARRTLPPEEEARQVAQLTKRLEDPSLPDDVVRRMLALHILETGGDEHARALIEAASDRERSAVGRVPDREEVTRQLATQLGVASLKRMALEVVEEEAAGEMRDKWRSYVERTADDDASSESVRRTTLARFIVDKADPASAQEKLSAALERAATG